MMTLDILLELSPFGQGVDYVVETYFAHWVTYINGEGAYKCLYLHVLSLPLGAITIYLQFSFFYLLSLFVINLLNKKIMVNNFLVKVCFLSYIIII